MRKIKLPVVLGLALLLVAVAAMSFMVGGGAPSTAMSGEEGLTVPSANMQLDANWKAQPVNAAPLRFAAANSYVRLEVRTQ